MEKLKVLKAITVVGTVVLTGANLALSLVTDKKQELELDEKIAKQLSDHLGK